MSDTTKKLSDILKEVRNTDAEVRFDTQDKCKAFVDGLSSFGEQFKSKVPGDTLAGTTTSRTLSAPEGVDPFDSDT